MAQIAGTIFRPTQQPYATMHARYFHTIGAYTELIFHGTFAANEPVLPHLPRPLRGKQPLFKAVFPLTSAINPIVNIKIQVL